MKISFKKGGTTMTSKKLRPWQASTHYLSTKIAGFGYYDGIFLLNTLEVGMKLDLFLEIDNPCDPNAVAIYRDDKKLGYLPRSENTLISQLLRFGHTDVFEVLILQIDKEAHPEAQVKIALRFLDKS